jgi:hypothetical protein
MNGGNSIGWERISILMRIERRVFKWWIPFSERYFPSWMEIVITLAIILTEIWVFRWIVTRMPVFGKPPAWAEEKHQ